MYTVKIKRLSDDVQMPSFAYPGDAGVDLRAKEDVEIYPGEYSKVPTGIAIQMPEPTEHFHFEAHIRPRSSTFKNFNILIPNSPATIDHGYRGELIVPVLVPVLDKHLQFMYDDKYNGGIEYGGKPVVIKKGERFAQLVINMIPNIVLEEVKKLDKTKRGTKGLGSSGK